MKSKKSSKNKVISASFAKKSKTPRFSKLQLAIVAAIVAGIGTYLLILSRAETVNTYYVNASSTSCTDNLPVEQRTSSKPFCTIPKALSDALAPAELVVSPGNYSKLEIKNSSKKVTIRGTDVNTVKIKGASTTNSSNIKFEKVTFSDGVGISTASKSITISNSIAAPEKLPLANIPKTCDPESTGQKIYTRSQGYAISVVAGTDTLLVENSEIRAAEVGYGMILASDPTRPVISNVTVRKNKFEKGLVQLNVRNYKSLVVEDNDFANNTNYGTPWHTDVIYAYTGGDGFQIRRNHIHDAYGTAIQMKGGVNKNVVIENNLIHHIGGSFKGLNLYRLDNAVIANNTILASTGFREGAKNVKLYNNIISVFTADPKTNQFDLIDYNYFGKGAWLQPKQAHPITTNPTYVNYEGRDYHLAKGSAGIDAGLSTGAPEKDYDNLGRVDAPSVSNTGAGTKKYIDIGAFENQEGSKAKPPTSSQPSPVTQPTTPSVPSPQPETSLEGESFNYAATAAAVADQDGASNGKALSLSTSTEISRKFKTDKSYTKMIVTAKSRQCGDTPALNISVDGKAYGRVRVNKSTLTQFPVELALAKGDHTLVMSYTNDADQTGTCNGSVTLDVVNLQ